MEPCQLVLRNGLSVVAQLARPVSKIGKECVLVAMLIG